MDTDDMKPQMETILTLLFGTDEGLLTIPALSQDMRLNQQEVMYHVEKLQEKELVSLHFSTMDDYCTLTAKGRAYVMENLKK